MAAHAAADEAVPAMVLEALHDAMEIAVANVPCFDKKVVYLCPDVSASMAAPITGRRRGGSTVVRCIDVAALMTAALLRRNVSAEVLPFKHDVVRVRLRATQNVMKIAAKLARLGGGDTNCSAPLALLNRRKARGDLVVFISDNESWVDARRRGATQTMIEWDAFKQRNPAARLVRLDIQPSVTTQAVEREDILNLGGFSDQVFGVIAEFAAGRLDAAHWVGEIGAVAL